MSKFRQANRAESWLKLAIEGISGAGKTYSSIKLMKGLCGDGRFVMFDTENGSGELYSHLCQYDYFRMQRPFRPVDCVELINDAVKEGYNGIIIDSFSHFWKYILEYKEALDQRPNSNSFRNWGKVKPMYEELKGTILHSPIHICCNLRSKAEYVQTNNAQGKAVIEKVGVNPITEPENEYEFTTVFSVDRTNQAQSTKDRTSMFHGGLPFTIAEGTGEQFLEWLHSANGGVYTVNAEWAEVSKGSQAAREATEEATRLGIGTTEVKELPAPLTVAGANTWLSSIGTTKDQFRDLKAICDSEGCDYLKVIEAAKKQNPVSFEHLLEIVKPILDQMKEQKKGAA